MKRYDFLDVGYTYQSLKSRHDAAYEAVMASGQYIGGREVGKFEEAFAAFCGARHCVGLGNGLDALVLPLRALGVGPGDEVIVPAHTFIATWLAVSRTGATPVPVDAHPETMNMDVDAVAAAVTDRTRAIIPVHLYGAPVRCARLLDLADDRGLLLLEDAAQAHGAQVDGVTAGALGHGAAFSFYPGKNLGAFGDGGAFVTDDADLADRVRVLANYGARAKYDHEMPGGNSRLDPLQAAFLSVKLGALADWTVRREEIATIYLDRLSATPGLQLPVIAPGTRSAWHLFVLRHGRRDALMTELDKRGVSTALHYPIPNHKSGAFHAEYGALSFPVAESICATCLSLPIGPHLDVSDAHEIATIVDQTVRNL